MIWEGWEGLLLVGYCLKKRQPRGRGKTAGTEGDGFLPAAVKFGPSGRPADAISKACSRISGWRLEIVEEKEHALETGTLEPVPHP